MDVKYFAILGIIFAFFLNTADAAVCGGPVQCNCGDTLVASQSMWYDLSCPTNVALFINTSNVTLDCNGHGIIGIPPATSGIGIDGSSGVTITECNIRGFYEGVKVTSSPNSRIIGNQFQNNYGKAIYVLYGASKGSEIRGNKFVGNRNYAILLVHGGFHKVTGNLIRDGGYAIYLDSSGGSNGEISGNIIENNTGFGIAVVGGRNGVYANNIIKKSRLGFYGGAFQRNRIYGNAIDGNSYYGMLFENSVDGNVIWNNKFTSNAISAHEMFGADYGTYNNSWNLSTTGNLWSDFASNPGYPSTYIIGGPGDGIDYHPLKKRICKPSSPLALSVKGGLIDADPDCEVAIRAEAKA